MATPGKATGRLITNGDIVVMQSAGGGGYGDPLSRDLERVEEDVSKGYVSVQRARTDYGLVMRDDGALDREQSEKLRKALRHEDNRLTVVAAKGSVYEGVKGRHRVLRINPQAASERDLEAGQLVELLGSHPAPLRAWVRIDGSVPRGSAPLDEFAQRALGTQVGGVVRLRKLDAAIRPGDRMEEQREPRGAARGRRA